MKKIIDLYYFSGWTRKEKREFVIALVLTVLFCIGLVYMASVLQDVIQPHEEPVTEIGIA